MAAFLIAAVIILDQPALGRAPEKKSAFEIVPADLLDPAERPDRLPARKPAPRARQKNASGPETVRLNELVDEFGGFGGLDDDENTTQSLELLEFFKTVPSPSHPQAGPRDFNKDFIPVLNEDIDTINRARARTMEELHTTWLEETAEPAQEDIWITSATLAQDEETTATAPLEGL